jgi:gamma-glutamyltranspeptidase / glutathione hydrolase
MRGRVVAAALCAVALVAGWGRCETLPPEFGTWEERSPIGMVVSASSDASAVGEGILAAGGNAVDAAVGTALALGIGEPAASGLGGGSLMLIHLADGRDVAIDGSVTVPSGVDPTRLKPFGIERRGQSGYQLVAVPRSLAALGLALQRYGTWKLADVLAPVIELATEGASYTPALVAAAVGAGRSGAGDPQITYRLLGPDGTIPDSTHLFPQPELATTLTRIAKYGIGDFYHGKIAEEIDSDMSEHGGFVKYLDLLMARAQERRPVRGRYRGFSVVSFPWPGGGPPLIEALNILSHFPSEMLAAKNANRYHLLLEAARIAQLDGLDTSIPAMLRERHQLDPALAARRAAQIHFDRMIPEDQIVTDMAQWHDQGTTQISVVDRWGNAVSITQSLGPEYGARVATAGLGFPYNGLLSAFEFENPLSESYAAPGRAPQTSAAPTIVLLHGKPFLVLGSAGSSHITSAILNVLVNVIDAGMPVREAVVEPRALWNVSAWRAHFSLEMAGPITDAIAEELCYRGFQDQYRLLFPAARPVDFLLFGNVNTVMTELGSGWLVGVGDPRRQSMACGVPVPEPTSRAAVAPRRTARR